MASTASNYNKVITLKQINLSIFTRLFRFQLWNSYWATCERLFYTVWQFNSKKAKGNSRNKQEKPKHRKKAAPFTFTHSLLPQKAAVAKCDTKLFASHCAVIELWILILINTKTAVARIITELPIFESCNPFPFLIPNIESIQNNFKSKFHN